MRSEPDGKSGGMLLRILADGLRPFRYRAVVRRLLGASEAEPGAGQWVSGRPPVGFPYAVQALPISESGTQPS